MLGGMTRVPSTPVGATDPGAPSSKRATLWRIARDRKDSPSRRFFALAEIVCLPVSVLTLVAMVVVAILRRAFGVQLPSAVEGFAVPVLCSGAVGYLTNFIAIKMLFEPYEATDKHYLRYCTFGLWKQGLVPSNKEGIARNVARQVEQELLKPETLSRELTEMVGGMVNDPATLAKLKAEVTGLVARHQQDILGFLIPRIRSSLDEAVGQLITADMLRQLWDSVAVKWLDDERNRDVAARRIVRVLQARAPQLVDVAREMLRDMIRRSRIGRLFPIVDLADTVVSVVDWPALEDAIRHKLGARGTHALVKQEIVGLAGQVRQWLDSPESQNEVRSFANGIRSQVEVFLEGYLRDSLPELVRQFLNSEDVWDWFQGTALPILQTRLELWLKSDGQALITGKLDIENRVVLAIREKDVRDVQRMIDAVAAEHLGAIQVLGYVLGLLAGVLLALQR